LIKFTLGKQQIIKKNKSTKNEKAMTKELDIIQIQKGVLVHPVFINGKLNGGFSYQVSKKYPNVELAYVDMCSSTKDENLLGKTLYTFGKNCEVAIASIFCLKPLQKYPDMVIKQELKNENCVDLDSFNEGVSNIKEMTTSKSSHLFNFPVYVPYKLGNKISSIEWKIVQKLIFGNISNAVICINKKNETRN